MVALASTSNLLPDALVKANDYVQTLRCIQQMKGIHLISNSEVDKPVLLCLHSLINNKLQGYF